MGYRPSPTTDPVCPPPPFPPPPRPTFLAVDASPPGRCVARSATLLALRAARTASASALLARRSCPSMAVTALRSTSSSAERVSMSHLHAKAGSNQPWIFGYTGDLLTRTALS